MDKETLDMVSKLLETYLAHSRGRCGVAALRHDKANEAIHATVSHTLEEIIKEINSKRNYI